MAGTRSSQRLNASSSPQSAKNEGGTKRKAEDTSPAGNKSKRGRPSNASKEQKTIEQTLPSGDDDSGNINVQDQESNANGAVATQDAEVESDKKTTNEAGNGNGSEGSNEDHGTNAFNKVKADENDAGTTSKEDKDDNANGASEMEDVKADAVQEDKAREDAMPSNILEKGVIYFFVRGRVGVDDPDSVQDLARSYFVLRPLPAGAKLTDGAIQDSKNARLVALPKKLWPKSGKDRFMIFVEKAETSMEILRYEFFQGSEYSTKTTGTRHTPDVTPIGEGVYAMTSTGGGQGTTHLAYMLTIPTEVGEVQQDVGLAAKGSFALSVKNPESSAPANTPQGAQYPKEIIEEFRGRGWMPPQPKHLNYDKAAVLLIGENFDKSSSLDPTAEDEKNDAKETPQEELEKLENEDELRIEHLKGDDSIFADLGISSQDYPKVMTTW